MLFDHWSVYDGIVSQGIVSDQKEVTAKPTITRTYARVPNRDHATFLKRLQEATTVHLAFYRDPDDDKCLAPPLAGKADDLVPEDLNFLSLEAYEGKMIAAVRP